MRSSDPIAEAHRQWVAHGWPAAADGMALVTSVIRVQQLLIERIDATLRPFNLTFARFEMLRVLAFTRKGEMPMAKLGSVLQVHPTSVTSAVRRLEDQGFARRMPSDRDKRVVLAVITDEGRAVIEAATKAVNADVFEHPGLPDRKVPTFVRELGEIRATLGDSVRRRARR